MTNRVNKKQPIFRNLQEKAEEINLVLLQPTIDLWKLRTLALSDGGLVNDTLRKRAWPKLVGLQKYERIQRQESTSTSSYYNKRALQGVGEEGVDTEDGPSSPSKDRDKTIAVDCINEDDPEQAKVEIDTALLPQSPSTSTMPRYTDLLVQSMDVEQIERDVSRCTWHLLSGSQRSRRNQIKHKDQSKKVATLLKKKQRRLANLINLTLVESYAYSRRSHDDANDDDRLRYYQGYHDVACIFMHALGGGQSTPQGMAATPLVSLAPHQDPSGLDLAAKVLCQVSFSHFRDNLRNNFVSLQSALKICLYPMLATLDPTIHDHLLDCDMEPFFCLSWVLTWFSHDVRDTTVCKRLFDAFLSSHPLLVLYMSLAMMLHPVNRNLILETDCDFAALHQCLVSLPRNSCKVGWKRASWQRGGGYVSDDADDDDDDGDDDDDDNDTDTQLDDETASTDMSSILHSQSAQTTPSVTSGNSSIIMAGQLGPTTIEEGTQSRVPFQELIDTSLTYMARYPPRCLEAYARRYYQHQEQNGRGTGFLSSPPQPSSTISLLQDPPTWSLLPAAPADWVLKQRLRQELGLKASSRKDRRKRAQAPTLSVQEELALAEIMTIPDYDYLKSHTNDKAVIAAGYGPGPEAVLERKRRRQRLAMAVAVGFMAMSVSLALQSYYSGSTGNAKDSISPKALLHRPKTANTTATILSTSTMVEETAIATTAVSSVVDYCRLPIAYMFNQSTVPSKDGTAEFRAVKDDNRSSKVAVPSLPVKKASSHSLNDLSKTVVENTSVPSTGSDKKKKPDLRQQHGSPPAAIDSNDALTHGHSWLDGGADLERGTSKLVRVLLQPIRFVLGKMSLQVRKGQVVLGNLRAWLEQPL